MTQTYRWDEVQRRPDGRILLLYRHQRVLDEGLVRPGMDVLDVGGWGMFAQGVIEAGARCTILDLFTPDQYYPDRVRALPHKVGNVLDADNFPAESFDAITCFETLEHVGRIDAAIANVHRWLRPDGWFAGTVPRPGHCHLEGEAGIVFVTEADLAAKLRAAGFEDVTVEPSGSIAPDAPQSCLYFRARRPAPATPVEAPSDKPPKKATPKKRAAR